MKVVTSLSSSSDKNNHQKKATIRIDMPNKYSLLDCCPSDEGGATLSCCSDNVSDSDSDGDSDSDSDGYSDSDSDSD